MKNPGSCFLSMVPCLSSRNAHVLAAQDITDLFNVEQRSVRFKKTSRSVLSGFKNRGEAESFLNMIIVHDCKFFERLQNL